MSARVEITETDEYDLIGRVVEILPRAAGFKNAGTAYVPDPACPQWKS